MSKKYLYNDDNWWYGSSWWWSTWWTKFDWWSWWWWFNDKQKIIDFKEKVQKKCLENYIPAVVSVNWDSRYVTKNNKLYINFSNSSVNDWDEQIDRIINGYEKVPYWWSLVWNMIYSLYVSQNTNEAHRQYQKAFEMFSKNIWWDSKTLSLVNQYFSWAIWPEKLLEKFSQSELDAIEKEISKDINEDGSMKSYDNIWRYRNLRDFTLADRFLKLIKSKIHIENIVDKEPSIRKWKRINRLFIEWRDYKPLVNKQVSVKQKKKILFLVDCSGSMWDASSTSDSAHRAVSFLHAIIKADLFDVTNIFFHSSWGYWDVKKEFIKQPHSRCWWWEWFERVWVNIWPEKLRWIDYVVTLTDLDIWESAQKWLYEFLSKGKKHLVLSFDYKWDLNWMNVRTIPEDNPEIMVQSLLTILN